ncbi:MAG: DEAD/DEAH box helicase [Thermoproteota archaeon]
MKDASDKKGSVVFVNLDGGVGYKVPKQGRRLVKGLDGVYCREGQDYFFCKIMRYLPQIQNIEDMKSAGFEVNINEETMKVIRERAEEEQENVYTIQVKREGSRAILIFDPDAYQASKEVEEVCSVRYNVHGSYAGWAERTLQLSKRIPYEDKVAYSVPWWLVRGLGHFFEKKGYTLDIPEEKRKTTPLPYNLEKNFELYDFQKEAYQEWLKAKEFATVVMPTGGGKTYVALKSIVDKPVNTLICVITEQLMNQWGRMLKELCDVPANGLGYYFARKHEIKPITIGMYHSLSSNIVKEGGKKLREYFDRVIFDEGHHVAAKTFKNVAFNLQAPIRMCLSATPERWDGNEKLIYFASGEKCYFIDYPTLVEKEIVAPLDKFTYTVPLTEQEKKSIQSIEKQERRDRGGSLKYYHQKARINLQAKNKLPAINKILEKHEGEKIFIFTRYLRQVNMISQHLKKSGIHHRVITGSTSDMKRRKFFQEFKEGTTKIIVTTTVLDEGVDVPEASVAIIAGGSGQSRQMIQRTGRVCRYKEGKTAYIYEVIADHELERSLHQKRTETEAFNWEDTIKHLSF